MSDYQIVAIFLLKNEDRFIDAAIRAVEKSCDTIILLDNGSSDRTKEICRIWAEKNSKVQFHEIQYASESQDFLKTYYNTKTWILGVDGDEIYDQERLFAFTNKLRTGYLSEYFQLMGNVVHCESISADQKSAEGFLSPPCKSMTKLYNFNAFTNWLEPFEERLHGGEIHFKDGFDNTSKLELHKKTTWEDSEFRCLHTVFMSRSSLNEDMKGDRPNIAEWNSFTLFHKIKYFLFTWLGKPYYSNYKKEVYRRGEKTKLDVSSFFYGF